MIKTKNCITCGKEFQTNNKRIYCSDRCADIENVTLNTIIVRFFENDVAVLKTGYVVCS